MKLAGFSVSEIERAQGVEWRGHEYWVFKSDFGASGQY
jgi:hypothetical protein